MKSNETSFRHAFYIELHTWKTFVLFYNPGVSDIKSHILNTC